MLMRWFVIEFEFHQGLCIEKNMSSLCEQAVKWDVYLENEKQSSIVAAFVVVFR